VGPELTVGLNINDHLEARTKSCGPELGCSGWACVGELGCSRSPDQELLGGIPELGLCWGIGLSGWAVLGSWACITSLLLFFLLYVIVIVCPNNTLYSGK
jgi:hypothetical protein